MAITVMTACSSVPEEKPTTITQQAEPRTEKSNSAKPTPEAQQSKLTLSVAKAKPKPKHTVAAPIPIAPKELWQRMREGFSLPKLNTKRVQFYERQFTAKPEYIQRIFTRASWFLPSILDSVEKLGYPTEIALLPAVESAFKLDAKSHSGASGLWQFIASTGRLYGMHENWWYDARRDPDLSTAAALKFLGELNARFDGDWFLSLAGYNAGGGNIENAIRKNKRSNKSSNYSSLKLRKETAHYVPKLIAFKNIIINPEHFNIKLPTMPRKPVLTSIDAGSQTDLSIFASKIGVDSRTLNFLNRAYKHGVTPPEGPHRIQIPIAKAAIAKQELKQLGEQDKMQWAHYRVQPGDVLEGISYKYNVSVAAIKRTNKLKSDVIYPGKILLIPIIKGAKRVITSVSNNSASKQLGTKVTHRVRKGDTLWEIARRYGVKVAQISLWNKISQSQTLRLGQKLLIYPRSS